MNTGHKSALTQSGYYLIISPFCEHDFFFFFKSVRCWHFIGSKEAMVKMVNLKSEGRKKSQTPPKDQEVRKIAFPALYSR